MCSLVFREELLDAIKRSSISGVPNEELLELMDGAELFKRMRSNSVVEREQQARKLIRLHLINESAQKLSHGK